MIAGKRLLDPVTPPASSVAVTGGLHLVVQPFARTLALAAALALLLGVSAARAGHVPLPVRGALDAQILGSARDVTLTVYGVGMMNADDAADLLLGELPTGVHGDEKSEPVVVLGRSTWPASAAVRSLQPLKLTLPVLGMDDSLQMIGVADVDGDGRDDLISQLIRQNIMRRTAATVHVNFSPESWSGRPNITRGDINIDAPGLAAYLQAFAEDLSGDGLPDLVLRSLEGVHIYLGRDPWPGTIREAGVDVTLQPATNSVDVADVTGDGLADIVATLIGEGADVALLEGRAAWEEAYDLAAEADARLGEGDQAFGARTVPDLDGDGLSDVIVADHDAGTVRVYPGGPDLAARMVRPENAAWSVVGITDTFDLNAFDLTGDGMAELVFDRTTVFFGGQVRTGAYDATDPDGRWEDLPEGWFFSGDVDGSGTLDVLVSYPPYSAMGGSNTGRVAILFGPRAKAPVLPTATEVPPTTTATATATDDPAPTATATGVATAPGTPGTQAVSWIFLPALMAKAGL